MKYVERKYPPMGEPATPRLEKITAQHRQVLLARETAAKANEAAHMELDATRRALAAADSHVMFCEQSILRELLGVKV